MYLKPPIPLTLWAVRAARPRAKEVLPVPGGPPNKITPWRGSTDREILGRTVKLRMAWLSSRSLMVPPKIME